jgi:hypothetical protein
MKNETIILYTLKGKTQTEKVQILRKLYGYSDKSNYTYTYSRKGQLEKIPHTKEEKTILRIPNKKDVPKITKILKELKLNFETVKT